MRSLNVFVFLQRLENPRMWRNKDANRSGVKSAYVQTNTINIMFSLAAKEPGRMSRPLPNGYPAGFMPFPLMAQFGPNPYSYITKAPGLRNEVEQKSVVKISLPMQLQFVMSAFSRKAIIMHVHISSISGLPCVWASNSDAPSRAARDCMA